MIVRVVAALALLTAVGCTGRQIEVQTGAETQAPAAAPTLRVNNTLAQAVNVYVVAGGNEIFVRQVAARSTAEVPVRGVTAGTMVTLRARQVDGRQVYERPDVVLDAGVFDWRVP